ncbi:unnamed protein product [Owenia fusiformis]|uniref:Uncharacterized protein n=1 Tax=Owenia fusiformis TaxID=6347 RepID=A0A8J1XLZ0_OWEFU|nr:unnamed protein product [Owenia fusiformis]
MSLQSILKNIYSFIEVLQSCRSDAVKGWDEQALSNAFKWAKYCEQISSQALGKHYEASLDNQIRKMRQIPLALGEVEPNLQLCSNACPVLRQALLQNPYLPDSLFATILTTYYPESPDTLDSILEECYTISAPKSGLQLALCDKESMTSHSVAIATNDKTDIPQEAIVTQGIILAQHLSRVCRESSRRERTEKYTREKLDEIYAAPEGMIIILEALIASDDPEEVSASQHSSSSRLILNWLLQKCDPGIGNKVWQCNPKMLSEVARRYHTFYQVYVAHLDLWGNNMVPVYGGHFTDGFTWRIKSSPDSSHNFEGFFTHIEHMVKSSDNVKEHFIKHIEDEAKQSEVNAWRTVQKYRQRDSLM